MKRLLVTGCRKSKEKILSNGNMFTQKKILPTFGAEVVKYVSFDNKWWEGPKCLQDQTQRPEQPKTE